MGKNLLIIFLLFFTMAYAAAQGSNQNSFIENELKPSTAKVELFPNPVPKELTVKIGDDLKQVEFEVYNIIGNSVKVEVEKVDDHEYKIPVRSLAPGYYLLIIKDKELKYRQAFKFQKK